MAAVTPEARIERFKGWLQAKSAPQNTANLKPGSNLLLAATLHGLARRRKGHKLNKIEHMGVKAFEALADSEEELNAYGEICSEAKKAARSRSFAAINVSNAVMELSDDTPLTREKFDEEVRRLGRETVLQPHIRSVTIDQVMPDGSIPESEEYAAASNALGRGLTMFVDPGDKARNAADTTSDEDLPLYVVLAPIMFKCYRKSGERGKDEIYFSWGFGSDGGDKRCAGLRKSGPSRPAPFGTFLTQTPTRSIRGRSKSASQALQFVGRPIIAPRTGETNWSWPCTNWRTWPENSPLTWETMC